ncbi:reverse transcriptase domain-containing protein [Tanacetum coccineum]
MRTRSSLEYTIPRRRNRRRSRQQQEAIPIVDTDPIPMADDRPMAEQLQAPTGGFESAIVVPPINAQNFELKSSLINLVQNRIFRGGNDEEPHAHIRHFESITNNQRNLFSEAWSVSRNFLRKCPHHGFSLMHQLDTFYNSLSYNDQDSLNSAAGGNFLYKSPTEGLQIIENKAKVRCSRNAVMRVSTNAPPSSSTSSSSNQKQKFGIQQMAAALEDKITLTFRNEMKNMMKALVPTPIPIKAVEERCTTCGSNHNGSSCPLTRGAYDYPVYHDNFQQFQQAAAVGGFVQGNSGYSPSSVASYTRPPGFSTNPQVLNLTRIQWNQGYNGTRNVNQTNQVNHGANLGLNQQAQAYQAPVTQVPVAYSWFEAYTKSNDATLTNLQKNLNDFKREQNGFQNEQRNFQKAMMSFMQNSGNNRGSNHASTSDNEKAKGKPRPSRIAIYSDDLRTSKLLSCVPIRIARDVLVPVGRLTFPADFVVVDFECDYRVPLILGRPFLRTARTLIDVFGEEMSLRTDEERLIISEVEGEKNLDVKTIVSFFAPIGNCVRKWATNEFVKDNDEINHEVFKSDNEKDLGVHDNEEEEIAFLDGLLENENFFEMNDKKVESLERKTKEDFETKDEPKSKKELQVVHPDIEILNHFETTSYVGSDYVFYEDFNLVDMLFPMNIRGEIFDTYKDSFCLFGKKTRNWYR